MNKLIVPTDFSPVSDNALQYAIDMSLQHKFDINLFHVVLLSTPSISNMAYVDVSTDFLKQAEESMSKKAAALQALYPSIQFNYKVETGLFLDSLKEYCEEINPIAIIMGITGDGTTIDKFIGSNTIFAMQSINFPLIVVPKHGVYKSIQQLCFACDLKNVANSTPLLAIKAFAKLFGAKIHILNIDFHNKHFTPNTPHEIEVLNLMFENIDTEFHFIEHEFVQDAMNDFIERNGMDMLVMIPKKHSFFESLFKKSRTKEMLYQSHIPILALHQN
jgi:nucleotide-binding universal stress UspA family protein